MTRAAVAALAVDHHARGEHDAPAEPPRRQRREQHRGRQVVVRRVVGDVVAESRLRAALALLAAQALAWQLLFATIW